MNYEEVVEGEIYVATCGEKDEQNHYIFLSKRDNRNAVLLNQKNHDFDSGCMNMYYNSSIVDYRHATDHEKAHLLLCIEHDRFMLLETVDNYSIF